MANSGNEYSVISSSYKFDIILNVTPCEMRFSKKSVFANAAPGVKTPPLKDETFLKHSSIFLRKEKKEKRKKLVQSVVFLFI